MGRKLEIHEAVRLQDEYQQWCIDHAIENPGNPMNVFGFMKIAGYFKGFNVGAMCKCQPPEGLVVKPDGEHTLDPCVYEVKETHDNVKVTVSQCKNCGHVDISWTRKEETESTIYDELADVKTQMTCTEWEDDDDLEDDLTDFI